MSEVNGNIKAQLRKTLRKQSTILLSIEPNTWKRTWRDKTIAPRHLAGHRGQLLHSNGMGYEGVMKEMSKRTWISRRHRHERPGGKI